MTAGATPCWPPSRRASCWERRRSSRSELWPRPVNRCRRSRPSSIPRSRPACCSTRSSSVGGMRATARRENGTLKHDVAIREHMVVADEPEENGGDDSGPSPQELLAASLASCTAITIEMYAKRKGWDVGDVSVDVDYEPAQRGSPTRFVMSVKFPKELPEDQRERLMQIAAKCPVHRTLEGEVMFEETAEVV